MQFHFRAHLAFSVLMQLNIISGLKICQLLLQRLHLCVITFDIFLVPVFYHGLLYWW